MYNGLSVIEMYDNEVRYFWSVNGSPFSSFLSWGSIISPFLLVMMESRGERAWVQISTLESFCHERHTLLLTFQEQNTDTWPYSTAVEAGKSI